VAAPPATPSLYWEIVEGFADCHVSADGSSVTDGDGRYGRFERCNFKAKRDMFVSVQTYDMQDQRDKIVVITADGAEKDLPSTGVLPVLRGAVFQWRTNRKGHGTGFVLVASASLRPQQVTPAQDPQQVELRPVGHVTLEK